MMHSWGSYFVHVPKVFCQFINRQSEAISSFDVRRWMLDVGRSKKNHLYPMIPNSLGIK